MRSARASALLATLLLVAPGLLPGQTPSAASSPAGTTVLQAGTSLVVEDVVVTDTTGHPVPGLSAADFRISEDKAPQTPHSFEEVRAADRAAAPKLPPMPPGVFTDYEPTAKGPLNVLLVDALNTPLDAQIYLKEQLREYIRHAPPGTRIAIFGLNAGLTMLQGFTSDPEILRAAVDHKLTGHRSDILNDPTGTRNGSDKMVDGLEGLQDQGGRTIAAASELIKQFEAQEQAHQTQVRILDTLNAFTVLGHYLGSFPGRKNLVWFSGSFPLNILPDPTLKSPFQITENNSARFKAMSDLLLQAQVAVYPVDARALETTPMYDASRGGGSYVGPAGGDFSKDLSNFQASRADEHATMEALAHDTGGRAFLNTNALADAVNEAIRAGSNYYSLTYSPTDKREDGSFRQIHVELTGAAAARGYTLAYRRGYYASLPAKPGARAEAVADGHATETTKPGQPQADVPYEATAMGHGAPTPSELLFKVRLLPASAGTEPHAAPGNHVNGGRAKGPFRPYSVDFVALPAQLHLPLGPNGHRTGHVEFVVYVFDSAGDLLVTDGQSLDLDLSPAEYNALLHEGLKLHLTVSAPARGESYFRMAVHDLDSRKMGVLEVSSLAVANLPPPAPSAGKSAR